MVNVNIIIIALILVIFVLIGVMIYRGLSNDTHGSLYIAGGGEHPDIYMQLNISLEELNKLKTCNLDVKKIDSQ